MMDPHPSREEILRWTGGEHESPDAVAAHVGGCPGCAGAASEIRREAGALSRRLAGSFEPPARAFVPRRAGFRWRIAVPAAAAAAAALAVLLRGPAAPPPVVATVVRGTAVHPAGRAFRAGEPIDAWTAPLGIRFSDGTSVLLDTGTSVGRLAERRLTLGAGRIHVSAQGAPGFVVETRAGRAVDLGTVFLVEAGAASSSVTVVRGSVRLEPLSGAPVTVPAGRSSPISAGAAPAPAPIEERCAWVRGIVFPALLQDEPLGKVFGLLEETGSRPVEAPERLRALRVTGMVGGLSTQAILETAAAAAGARLRIDGDRAVFTEP